MILRGLPRKKPKKTLIYSQTLGALQICKRRIRSKTYLRFSRVQKAQTGNTRRHPIIGRIMKTKKGARVLPRWCMGKTKVTQIIQIKTSKSQYLKVDHGQQVLTQRFILKLEIRERKRALTNRSCIH
jgi:hypothetical protein